MGTRAMITKNGKPFIATHWDGYPSCLGAGLLTAKTDAEIIAVAEKHTVDFAVPSVQKKLNKKRFSQIAEKANNALSEQGKKKRYSAALLEKMYVEQGKMLSFSLHSAGDSPIGSIRDYDDWAEFQYDLTDGKWRFRPLSGMWSESKKSEEKFEAMTGKAIEEE